MKKIVAFLLAMIVLMGVMIAHASTEFEIDVSDLSNRHSRYQPAVYVKPQVMSRGNTRDVALYTSMLPGDAYNEYGGDTYGLYWKYTNNKYKNGIPQGRRDIVIYDPWGTPIYREWFNAYEDWELRYNWYRYNNFMSLDDMFVHLMYYNGYIKTGSYRFVLYIEKEYAGEAKFKIN